MSGWAVAAVAGLQGIENGDPGVHDAAGAASLVAIALAAFVLPLIAGRLAVPGFVLEIMFGLMVGPVLGWVDVGQGFIGFLAELGLLLLLFLAGFEIDFNRLERQGMGQVLTALGLWTLFLGAGWMGAGYLDTPSWQGRLFLSLLIASSAVGLVVPALRESNRTATRLGQLLLLTAIVGEVLSLLGVMVLSGLVEGGATWRLLSVPALLGAAGLALWTLLRGAWWHPDRFERLFSRDDPHEMGTRSALALLFTFVGLSALLDVEAILGAFLAGTIFAYVFREPGPLAERLRGFSFGFFVPVFFVNIGLGFPLGQLLEPKAIARAAVLIGIAFAAKVVPSLVLMLGRFSFREALASGVLLAGQLSVVIALAGLGLSLGIIEPEHHAGAVLLVVVGAVLCPVLFQALGGRVVERRGG